MENIEKLDISSLPNSAFMLAIGKRRSGKSFLIKYMLQELKKAKQLDLCYLFSTTNAGFENIPLENRFDSLTNLHHIVKKMSMFNQYNKIVDKEKDKIKLRIVIILDDMALKLKSKEFNILEELAVNGRHSSYPPLSMSFVILSQSLTKISRVVRLNSDILFLNAIPSQVELNLILDENFYILDGSRLGKQDGRALYNNLVTKEPFTFVAIESYKQNVVQFSDYIKTFKALY
tara:strand:- start:306 stop:1001 length:696 start_codon:yes stop_codon:yes gene_type:complete